MSTKKSDPTGHVLSKLGLVFLLCMFSVMTAFAQNGKVTGKVVDGSGEPIIGATVMVKGTSNGAITDLDGNYTLQNVPANSTVTVSYIGYKTQELALNGKNSVNVTLQVDDKSLDEVVVVGYGVQKKSDVTGAMLSVSAKELTERPTTNVFDALQGHAAGVDIRTSDRPGEIGDVYIRGSRSLSASSSPLYVVDGVPLNTTSGQTYEESSDGVAGRGGSLESFNPEDIESIEILKDASATAIYGSRGANGVVLITTKKGAKGRTTISYSGSITAEQLEDRTTWMTADEYLTWRRWSYYYLNPDRYPRGDQPTLETDRIIFNAAADQYAWNNVMRGWESGTWQNGKVLTTDWHDMVKRTGLTTQHTVSASGGSDKMQSYASFGWLRNEGVVKGQDYQRYTANVNTTINTGKWLTLSASVNATYSKQNYGFSKNGSNGGGHSTLYDAAGSDLVFAVPYDDEGNVIEEPGGDSKIKSVAQEWNKSKDERLTFRAIGAFSALVEAGKIWEPLQGLTYKLSFGPDFRYFRDGVYNDGTSVNREGVNFAQLTKSTDFSWTLDNLINYNRQFDVHSIGLTLLQTATGYRFETNNMSAEGVPIEGSLWNALTTTNVTSLKSYGSDLIKKQLESYMMRLNYTLMDRYMLTASVRWDGASQLAEGHKWSTFPSVALGWRMEQESWLRDVNWIEQLKLRAGYGVTGNAEISPYQTKGRLASLFYPFGSAATAGYTPYSSILGSSAELALANQDLTWEKTHQLNFGVDFSFLDGRISGVFDIYTSKTKDLLMAEAIPTVTGYAMTYANIGETKNFGYDITLNLVPIKYKDFTWNVSINAAYSRNKITKLANGDDITNGWFVGQSTSVIYGYKSEGLWREGDEAEMKKFNDNGSNFEVGMTRVADLNGDGKIDPNNDRTIIGHRDPRWNMGINTDFNYKNWSLGIQFYGRFDYMTNGGGIWVGGRYNVRKYDYYNENNKNAYYQKPIYDEAGKDVYYESLGYLNSSYMMIRNISLSYTFPKNLISKWGLSNLRVYAQCKNPGYLFCKLDYTSPDTNSSWYTRGFTFGLNVSF